MTQPILIAHNEPTNFQSMLETRFPQQQFVYATTAEEIVEQLQTHNPEVAFSIAHSGFLKQHHSPITAHPSTRWVQVGGAGFDHFDPWDNERITLTNCSGVLSRFLAEMVTGAMIALNTNMPQYGRQQRETVWQPIPFRPLVGQTLLVLGLGNIGRWVAHNAKALGMTVWGMRRNQTMDAATEAVVDRLFHPDQLLDIIGEVDILTLHVSLTDATEHLINGEVFAAMKQGALLLNSARGKVVEEAALIDALSSGKLGGAYLDVFAIEPLPTDNPLWSLPNVVMTPHAADIVEAWDTKFAEFFADNLERYLNGEALANVVQPS
ncbi:MAG: D-2-hydroxyacid dehydrogenase [Chloroflexota bacterium]